MSNFELDLDSPYPKPEAEKLKEKPKRMSYPKNKIRFSYYGNTISSMIDVAIQKGCGKRNFTGMIKSNEKTTYPFQSRIC